MNLPTPFEIAAFALGLAGTTLGIINGVRQIFGSRVRLRIRCYGLVFISDDSRVEPKESVCIEIANQSSFAVTIKEVAFEPRNYPKGRMSNAYEGFVDGKRPPVRVEPRASIQVLYKSRDTAENLIGQARRLIVETACGEVRYGSLKSYQKQMAAREKVTRDPTTVSTSK